MSTNKNLCVNAKCVGEILNFFSALLTVFFLPILPCNTFVYCYPIKNRHCWGEPLFPSGAAARPSLKMIHRIIFRALRPQKSSSPQTPLREKRMEVYYSIQTLCVCLHLIR